MQVSPSSYHFIRVRFVYDPKYPVLEQPQSVLFPSRENEVSRPHNTTGNIIVL